MEYVDPEHLASLTGNGLYSYIATSQHSQPFHNFVEKTIKNTIGDFKNPYMDAVSGKWHRWKHGHDPLDIFGQMIQDPMGRGKLDFGHFLTDFLTKDGMPLPGLSKNYLGSGIVNTLENLGVERPIKWLNMNGFDHLFGGISLTESSHDLYQATLSPEDINFTWETALDTFGEGTLEIAFGLQTANLSFIASGVTEYISGSIILYKDIARDNLPIYEKLIENLPSQAQLTSALAFYMAISSLKSYISYSKGNITKTELRKNTLIDVSTSLGSFAITKSLITTISIGGITGGMLLPILIGGGSSLLLREILVSAYPNKITISEADLWGKSPFQYESPWGKSSFNNDNIWQKDIFQNNSVFDNGNIWQKDIFQK